MGNKLLNHVSDTIMSAAIVLASASLVSRILGLLRDRLLAHTFGANAVLDAYYAAFKIPDAVYNLVIVGALSAGFIPVFTKYRAEFGKEKAWNIVSTLLTYAGGTLIVLALILFASADYLMNIVAPGFDASTHVLAVQFTRIMFVSPILLGISAIAGGVLQSTRNFFVFAIAPIFYNIGIIIGITMLYPYIGERGLSYGVIIGALFHVILQYSALTHQGFHFQKSFHISPEIRKIIKLTIPRTLGLCISQISLIVVMSIASTLEPGSIASFQFAFSIAYIPIGIIAVSYAVAAFPALSETAQDSTRTQFIKHFSSATRHILFFLIPATVIYILFRAQIVRILLGSGAFDWNDTTRTYETLAMFAVGFVGLGLTHLLIRCFYAYEDTKTPVIISIISESIVITLAWHWSKTSWGISGIALAMSVGALFSIILLSTFLLRKTKSLDAERIIIAIMKMTLAAFSMALVMQYLKSPVASLVDMTTGIGILLQTGIVTLIGLVIYIFIGLCLHTYEMQAVINVLRKRLFSNTELPRDITETGKIE